MAKKKFGAPSIIHTLDGGDNWDIIGAGTGTGIPSGEGDDTTDYVTYDDWLILFEDQEDILDFDGDGEIGTENDWREWMKDNGFEALLP